MRVYKACKQSTTATMTYFVRNVAQKRAHRGSLVLTVDLVNGSFVWLKIVRVANMEALNFYDYIPKLQCIV